MAAHDFIIPQPFGKCLQWVLAFGINPNHLLLELSLSGIVSLALNTKTSLLNHHISLTGSVWRQVAWIGVFGTFLGVQTVNRGCVAPSQQQSEVTTL